MKKIFSNKTGFTLVEILVAFVIFAVMSSMILAIVRLAINARNSNNMLSNDLNMQQQALIREDKDNTFDASGHTGTFNLPFSDGTNTVDVSIDYEVRSAAQMYDDKVSGSTDKTVNEGLNYFIPNVVEKSSTPSSDDPGSDPGGNSQASRYDTRLTGSKEFEFIRVLVCKPYTGTYSGDADACIHSGVRYIFQTYAQPDTGMLNDLSLPYAQYKMYFKDDTRKSEIEFTKEDKKYKREVSETATILKVGYAKQGTGDNYSFYTNRDTSNYYKVTQLRNGGIQIGYDYVNSDKRFDDAGFTTFFVDFAEDPHLTPASFGSNGVLAGSSMYDYQVFVDDEGNAQPNIYGAILYNDVEVP